MGETIRIEIPVSVNDNTDPGLSNITNKMNTLATAAQKVNRILSSGFKTRGIEQTAERVDRTLGREHSIEVSVDDNATPVLSRVEDAAERVGGISADIEIGANDNAIQVISKLLLRARLKNWKAGRLQRISTFRRISEVRKRDRH